MSVVPVQYAVLLFCKINLNVVYEKQVILIG